MRAFVVIGLGYGDEGKGGVVDFLTEKHKSSLVVRFNGGAQAAHNVVRGGKRHTFHQFGSGTLAGAATLLSHDVVVDPLVLLREAAELGKLGLNEAELWKNLYLTKTSLVTTPYHVAFGRLRELARKERHGSCGAGFGETIQRALLEDEPLVVGDFADATLVWNKVQTLRERLLQEAVELGLTSMPAQREVERLTSLAPLHAFREGCLDVSKRAQIVPPTWLRDTRTDEAIIFEGAQGVLLDEDYGFHPHTTWSHCTEVNALEELPRAAEVIKIGVIRAFATRHGPGPFVTELDRTAPETQRLIADDHNHYQEWSGHLRVGTLDLPATRYAIRACHGIDGLAITHLDKIDADQPTTVCYDYDTPEVLRDISPSDLEARTARTQELANVAPITETVAVGNLMYGLSVSAALGVDSYLFSFGPDATAKYLIPKEKP